MNEFKITVTVQGITELTEAINRLAGQKNAPAAAGTYAPVPNAVQPQAPAQAPAGMPQGQMPVQAPAAYAQQGQVPVQNQPPVAPGVPVAGTVPQGQPPAPVPTAPGVQGYSVEQLQVAAAGLMSAGKGQQVMGILQRFGIQAMTELPRERYGEFAMALREAGAQI